MIPIELWGLVVWRHKENKNLFMSRPYYWCDRVIVTDETENHCDTKLSTLNLSDWIPLTVEEYKKVKRNYKDIYDECGS